MTYATTTASTDATDRAPRITPAERAALEVAPLIDVPADVGEILDRWLTDEIATAQRMRDERNGRIDKWRMTLDGRRPTPVVKTGMSNLSVPLTMWVRTAVRARLDQGVWEAKPILTVQPLRGRDSVDAPSNTTTANALGRLLTTEILNPRGLGGRASMTKTSAEIVDLGTSGLKVTVTPDRTRRLGPATAGGEPRREVMRGHVEWTFISRQDLLWIEGYGTDVNAMPLIGYEYDESWGDLCAMGLEGHYDAGAVERVRAFYETRPAGAATFATATTRPDVANRPAALRMHRLAELYMDYDVDGDGLPEAVLITWHIEARCRLRVVWSPIPSGRRPILMGNFDLPADLTSADGQGVCAKVEGVQDETDAVHNIAIEAGKRGACHVTVLKEDSRAEEEFGEGDEILPNDIIVTGAPDEDVVMRPLGDPQAAEHILGLEDYGRGYVTRMLGLDEARIGNVEAGKRVSAQVGMTTMREGRVVIRQVLGSIRDMMTEACYITLELWKYRPPVEALAAAFTRDEVAALMNSVFSIGESSVRSQFAITVNAEDAATAQEMRKNELMVVNQFLFTFYDKLVALISAMSQPDEIVPPPAKKALLLVARRMERGVEALLNTLDSIPNPDELLVDVNEMRSLLGQVASAAGAIEPGTGRPSITATDLGGGVA